MDKIIINGLQVKSLIGVYEWERKAQQTLILDAEISLDLSKAAKSDKVSDTLDYAAIALAIEELCGHATFELLEALADHIIQHLFTYEGVKQVVISITKPNILQNAKAVTVQLSRKMS